MFTPKKVVRLGRAGFSNSTVSRYTFTVAFLYTAESRPLPAGQNHKLFFFFFFFLFVSVASLVFYLKFVFNCFHTPLNVRIVWLFLFFFSSLYIWQHVTEASSFFVCIILISFTFLFHFALDGTTHTRHQFFSFLPISSLTLIFTLTNVCWRARQGGTLCGKPWVIIIIILM